jgi:hypothetical protein
MESMEGSSLRNAITTKGEQQHETLSYAALVRPILEYGAVGWDPYREGQTGALNRVPGRAAKFANNADQTGWESLEERRKDRDYAPCSRHTQVDGRGKLMGTDS